MSLLPLLFTIAACSGPGTDSGDTGPGDSGDTETLPPGPEEPLRFSEASVVLDTPGNAKTPSLAVLDDASVHIAWHDFSVDPANLYYGHLQDGAWNAGPLPLSDEKSIRPQLLAEGSRLHLIFDVWADKRYTIHHATMNDGTWGDAVPVAEGENGSLAVTAEGDLHIVYYSNDGLGHSRLVEDAWVAGDPIETDASVNPFGLRLLPHQDGLALTVAAGACSSMICYDIVEHTWDDSGWRSDTLYLSPSLSSDEPDGANMPDGSLAWVWSEQIPKDPWITEIVLLSPLDEDPVLVHSDLGGFSGDPIVAVPLDGAPMVAWLSPTNQIKIDRYPFGEPTLVFREGFGPSVAVDPDGFTHVSAYGYDDNSVQQIWYATNRTD